MKIQAENVWAFAFGAAVAASSKDAIAIADVAARGWEYRRRGRIAMDILLRMRSGLRYPKPDRYDSAEHEEAVIWLIRCRLIREVGNGFDTPTACEITEDGLSQLATYLDRLEEKAR